MVTIVVVYGTSWCPDVQRSRNFLDKKGVSYKYIDVDQDEEAAQTVRDMNNGKYQPLFLLMILFWLNPQIRS